MMTVKPILMGAENPEGLKLEDVLDQLCNEVAHKINKIINDPSPQAKLVVRNNQAIIEHLGAAAVLQKSSYVVLDAMKANEGPTGQPRIGNTNS
ncbi:histidine kinase (plasmid) [Paenibacillus rhizovicinus]|uniref:Histidine kinase n=1 Tax=Paenibacillus rhizovicinus TaxID=2704463 RepID=A0A6C0PBL9_9BACL|nr:histidine kinase [Paenibacillus rhizovicinus]QHW35849.1 histidine kinase [Paenibacillus rhizovicinus]